MKNLSEEICYLSLTSLAMKIRKREVSPIEIMESFIYRIKKRNITLNSFVSELFDKAFDKAVEYEKKIIKGNIIGPLHGIPVALKDLSSSKPGTVLTMGGIPALKNNITNHLCFFSEKIEKAGGIIIGKTNSPTMGFRGTCDNFLFGATRNPFDIKKNSGGSSGGSAAAVADGMLPMAEGTDGGGSIRIPSAWCGVYGFKASNGRIANINRPNVFSLSSPFSTTGPITRTVEDAALTLNILTGFDERDPSSVMDNNNYLSANKRTIEGWRIGYSEKLDVYPVEPSIIKLVEKNVKVFEEAGANVESIKIGIGLSHMELSDLWCRLMIPRNIGALETYKMKGIDLLNDHLNDFPPELIKWILKGYKLSVVDQYNDQILRSNIFDLIQSVFSKYDLIVTPTVACNPVFNKKNGNTLGPKKINGDIVNPLIGWALTYIFNLTGHPAASVPIGLNANGMPVGMQIIGRRNRDIDVITASAVFEKIKPWDKIYMKCIDRKL